MASFFAKLGAFRADWLWRSVRKALALNLWEARPDGLLLERSSLHLTISWRARDIHPWDRDLPAKKRALRLVEQTFSDTQAALERLFAALPEVDVIDLNVLEADSRKHGTLLSGSVSRNEFEKWRPSSIPMRLRLLGINYNLINSRFEPLDQSCREDGIPGADGNPPNESYDTEIQRNAPGEGPAAHVFYRNKVGPG